MICFSDTQKCSVIFSVSLDLLFGSFFSIKRKERTLKPSMIESQVSKSFALPRVNQSAYIKIEVISEVLWH